MTVKELQDEIIRLKKEKDVCILAHAYQKQSILEVADYTGDSFGLSVQGRDAKNNNIMMCGVRFMAETCKVLSPNKRVYLPNPAAGCPMAEQMSVEELRELKKKHPDYAVVCYINTTVDLKTECDMCVTSSSAVRLVGKMKEDKILFIPDPNLGSFVADKLPEKEFVFYNGGCPVHYMVDEEKVLQAKKEHPNALLLVHPECKSEVVGLADYVGATTGIMDYAIKSDAKEFIIGTENSIVEHLQFDCPEKKFYPLSVKLSCANMRLVTLYDIYNTLSGKGGEEIILDKDVIEKSSVCINRMIEG
ncbi:MAG: quinolinate synthase NadA [Lachnospiraceae bacterium]|nr:quinolinate synthase NadA [Lachnospiraceae bacterium]